MDELEIQKERLKRKHQNYKYQTHKNKTAPNYLGASFTRFLLAVIFVLISSIYMNLSEQNRIEYKKQVFETNLSFTQINEWYEKIFGSALPIDLNANTIPVNKTTNDFKEITKYQNGVECQTTKGSIISALNSGILVFLGEKENYGNVAIIQGIDGVDIWYGNIENINLSLYDYVEKDTLLGSAKEDKIYLVFQKDGQFLNYEEYKNQI